MNSSDLQRLQSGDLVEFQLPVSKKPSWGTFQRWHTIAEGHVRMIVRSQQFGGDLPVDPRQVIRFTPPSEDCPSPAPLAATDPALPRPGRRPPDAQGAGSRRLHRQTAWLSLAALLLVGLLGVGGLLLVQGPLPTAQHLGGGSPVGHTPGAQHSPPPPPGSSPPPTGGATTPPAPSALPSSGTTPPAPGTLPSSGTTPPAPAGRPTTPPGSSPTAPAPAPRLSVNPTSLVFFLHIGTCILSNPPQVLTIQNTGGGSLSWQATIQDPTAVSIDTSSGTLGPSGTSQMRVTATCGMRVSARDTITLTSNGGNVTVTVTLS